MDLDMHDNRIYIIFIVANLEISHIHQNSPAWRAGEHIRKGDLLVQIQVKIIISYLIKIML